MVSGNSHDEVAGSGPGVRTAGPDGRSCRAITATELTTDQAVLGGFNLILSGSLTTSNETEGQAVIGGDVNGSTQFCFNGCRGNSDGYGALTVYGNLNGYTTGVFAGDVHIGGNINGGTVNLQSGGAVYVGGSNSAQIPAATSISPAPRTAACSFRTWPTRGSRGSHLPLRQLRQRIGPPTGRPVRHPQDADADRDHRRPIDNYTFFNTSTGIVGNGVLVTVYQITAATLANMTNLQGFNLSAGNVIVINVLGRHEQPVNLQQCHRRLRRDLELSRPDRET